MGRSGDQAQRIIRAALVVLLVAVCVAEVIVLLRIHAVGVDLEIPLRAAERWLAGERVYRPEAFQVPGGANLPFLYPPFVLPLVSPLLSLPRLLLFGVGMFGSAVAAWLACRRLGMRPWLAPLVLLWPPVFEGILGTNVGIILFAAFVAIYWPAPGKEVRHGIVAATIAALKISLVHPWLNLLARRPRAAVTGLAVTALVALVTLPLVGIGLWSDWIGQAGPAADPAWRYIGAPMSRFVPQPLAIAVTVATLVASALVRGPMAGVWIGVLMVVGAPSLHFFGLAFLVPALLVIRREIALVAAALLALPSVLAIWVAIALIVGALVFDRRLPEIRLGTSRE